MAKKTYAEMKELLGTQKEESKQAKKDLKKFCQENKLELEAEHTDNKKWVKLKALVDKTAKAFAETEAWLAENKEKKEGKPRATRYEYPADVTTAADKKKFRAQARADAKKKAKAEAGGGSEKVSSKKKDKGSEKTEKSEKAEKTGKSSKKDKKAEKAAAED